jgi:DNA-binding NarL/FixJ family response regulator
LEFWHVELEKIIPTIPCPALVLHSRHDCVIQFEEGRRVASLLPHARFVPLQSRNHILLGSELGWQQFLGALDEFIPGSCPPTGSLETLTAREREIITLLAEGHDNRNIATRLRIAEKTARNHVSSVFQKLGVKSRAQAVAFARDLRSGLLNREGR